MLERFIFDQDVKNAHLTKVDQSNEIMEKLDTWITKPQNIFLFHGNVGTGKSYFCQAWYNHMYDQGIHVRPMIEDELIRELKREMSPGKDPESRLKTICESDYLIIDDFASTSKNLADKDWTIDMLSMLITLRYNCRLPTLITSNKTKQEFRSIFNPRTCSRLFDKRNIICENYGYDRREPQF
jgi:DNA replication protein DnaC